MYYNTAGILFGVNSHQIGFMTNMVYSKANNNLNIGVNTNIYDRNHFGSDNNGYYDLPSNSKYYTNTGYKEDAIVYVKYIKTIDRVNLFADIQSRNVWFHAKSDSFSTQTYNWNFLNPKAGLKIIGMNNDWSLSFGNTKREPTRTDMIQNVVQTNNLQYANTDNINILKGYNSNLNPENAYNVEFGNSYHSKYLYFNFNLYYLTINNEYVANGNIDKYSGFMIKEVASKTVRYGIEGDGKFTQPVFFIGKLNFFWNFQYQYNKLTNNAVDSKITFCPDLTINGGVSFTGKSGITLGIYNQYVSSMIMNLGSTQNSSKPYFITNCFIDYRIDSHSIVSFKMNNLYNVKYYIPAGIGYTDANANYQSVPTYYVGQTINWNLTIKHTL